MVGPVVALGVQGQSFLPRKCTRSECVQILARLKGEQMRAFLELSSPAAKDFFIAQSHSGRLGIYRAIRLAEQLGKIV